MASVVLASEWVIGAVFVTAGLLKFADRRQFVSEVADYRVLPRALVVPAATLLPAVEIVAGALVFVPVTRTAAMIVLALCLVAFTAAVVVNLLRGRTDLSCACFGRRSRRIDWLIPTRNGLMLAVLAAGLTVSTEDAVPSTAAFVTVLLGLVLLWTAWEARALTTPIGGQS